jgi:hypothetical protein
MNAPFLKVAEEIHAINEYIKVKEIYNLESNPEEFKKVSDRVDNILKYAEKNGVPLKVSTEALMNKIRNVDLGEMEEEEFEESSEDEYDEYED